MRYWNKLYYSRLSQTWPVQPAVQLHLPLNGSHDAPFSHMHRDRQSSPYLPSGHSTTVNPRSVNVRAREKRERREDEEEDAKDAGLYYCYDYCQ